MRAHRTRMLAAVLGTAVLVTGVAPAAVLRRQARRPRQPARHGPGARSVGRSVRRPSVDPSSTRSAYAGANR